MEVPSKLKDDFFLLLGTSLRFVTWRLWTMRKPLTLPRILEVCSGVNATVPSRLAIRLKCREIYMMLQL